jgi:proteasome lid subunit RPN8/RPN11
MKISLSDSIKKEILEDAKRRSPEEICGLIIIFKGREKYHPCKNLSDVPRQTFVLSPSDYSEAEDLGEIIAVVHSHPYVNPAPSDGDRFACEKSGLPWFIVNPQTEKWGYCEPEGFELPYVGREFIHGLVDCYTLCRDWYQKELGLKMNDYFRRDDWWDNGENLYVDNFKKEGFYEIPVEDLKYGDALLMTLDSSTNTTNHAAIYLGDMIILHHVGRRLSSRDVYGGYYQKVTAMALRHESQ